MGEVYLARDVRLNRDVALKILRDKDQFDAHRLARFQREAQVLASLNHPNIATLLGIEAVGDVQALVLEFVKGEVWANVWTTDFIARVDPATGRVTGWIDLRGLLPARERAGDAVLNGIAYDAANDRLLVTGKLWPRVFEIKLVSR